jgi:hypothetical protein
MAERVALIHASPGGKLEQLCREAATWGARRVGPDHPANLHLAPLGVSWVGYDDLVEPVSVAASSGVLPHIEHL